MENDLEFNRIVNQIISNGNQQHEIEKNIFAGKVLLQKMVYTVSVHCVKLTMKAVIGFGKIKKKSVIRTLPSVCVMSLSQDQLFQGKTRENLTSFFFESRFKNPTGDILIETKSIRAFQLSSSTFQPSIPIYFFLRNLSQSQRIAALDFFSSAAKSLTKTSLHMKKANLKTLYFLFELAVWFTIRAEKITLITTQSTMRNLPVAFRISTTSFTRKMFWYSTNSQPIRKKEIALEKPIFSESLKQDVDMHYVWDLDSKKFLNSDGIGRVSAVGSILFIQPQTVDLEKPGINLAYFDVTPFEYPDSYYTVERMCTNLSKLVEVLSRMNAESHQRINLLVKPKRELTGSHSRQYVQMLKDFEKEDKLHIVSPETNLYGFISSVNCVIGIPFTSPVVVGRELMIPSIYMDVHKDDFHVPSPHNSFSVLSDEMQLISWLEKVLGESLI